MLHIFVLVKSWKGFDFVEEKKRTNKTKNEKKKTKKKKQQRAEVCACS